MRGFSGQALLLAVLGLAGWPTLAQDLEPRSYTNVPVGEHFILAGLARSEGDLAPTPSSPLQDAELTIDSLMVGYAGTFDLAGSSAKVAMTAAQFCYEGSATVQGERVSGQRCGHGDPQFKLTWNFYGAPALRYEEFGQWDRGLVVGASLLLSAPWGEYHGHHLVNAGANRWMVRPGLGMSLRRGSWQLDLMGSVKLFEDNGDYFGGSRLEQKPLYAVQGHVIYQFRGGNWLSLNANFYRGGETTVDGVEKDDYVSNSRWGVTLALPLNARHSLKLNASTGVITRVGSDFDTLGAAWQYRF